MRKNSSLWYQKYKKILGRGLCPLPKPHFLGAFSAWPPVPLSDGLDTRPCKILDPLLITECEITRTSDKALQTRRQSGTDGSCEWMEWTSRTWGVGWAPRGSSSDPGSPPSACCLYYTQQCQQARLSHTFTLSSALFQHFNDDEAATWCFHLFLSDTRTIACCTVNFFASISSFTLSIHFFGCLPWFLIPLI